MAKEAALAGKTIGFFIYDDMLLLDIAGPLEVFTAANACLRRGAGCPGFYRIELLAQRDGPARSTSGVSLYADRRIDGVDMSAYDTLVLGGAGELETPLALAAGIAPWLAAAAGQVRRVAAVRSGVFLLAGAGLLNGRRAVTHWLASERLAALFPRIAVEAEPIFIRDGPFCTSAGAAAAMDMALAFVEEDLGREVALEVARELVMFLKRPGGQAQLSAQLAAQMNERSPLGEVQAWILENFGRTVTVDALAERAHMSTRNFLRVFGEAFGTTPAQYVLRVRLEAASRLLEDSRDSIESIARRCGFGNTETLRRNFVRRYGTSPNDYRKRLSRS